MQFFFFDKSISSSICKLPISSEIYNCTFKNTTKVIIIIIIIIIHTLQSILDHVFLEKTCPSWI